MNLPNFFTLFRLISSLVVILLYLSHCPYSFDIILLLYTLAAVSDYFDGKLARKYNIITIFGKCFDIIADKVLVLAVLLVGMQVNSVHIVFVFIILAREFTVSGLREVLASENISIPASKLGKWKTGFQMTACGFAVGQFSEITTGLLLWTKILAFVVIYITQITFILFAISSVLTLLSGYCYIQGVFFNKQK